MVNVCQTCGDEGFVEALVFCDSCSIESVHRYCLDITPVPFVDYITWFCEDCDGSDSGSDCNEVDQTAKLTHVLKKSEKKKKKKEKKKSSNDTPAVLTDVDHEIQDAMDVEPVKVSSSSPIKETKKDSKRRESSDIEKLHELTGLERNGTSVLEAKNGAYNLKENENKMKKKMKKSSNDTLPVLADEDHELQDAMDVEPVKVSSTSPIKETMKESKRLESSNRGKPHELTGFVRNGASVSEVGNSSGVLEHKSRASKKRKLSSVEKMKKKSSNATQPVLADEEIGLQGAMDGEHLKVSSSPINETMKESIRRESLERNGASILEAKNGAPILKESKKKKKKKKKSSNHTQPDLVVVDQEHHDATSVEPVKVSSAKETAKESKKQESSGCGKHHELTDLIRNGASVLEAGNSSSMQDHNSDSSKNRKLISVEKKKKKKKKKKMKKKKSGNLVLAVEDHGLRYATSVEPVKVTSSPMKETANESRRWESSDKKKSHELTDLVRKIASVTEAGNGSSVLEKSDKKKKKKMKSSNDKPPDLAVKDHGLKDATIVEPVKVSSQIKETMKESKRGESSDSGKLQLTGVVRNGASDLKAGNGASILEKSEKKKKKKKKSSNQTLPDLADEDRGLKDATSVEPVNVPSSSPIKETAKECTRQESSESKEPHGSTGLVRNGASISEAGNSSSVPDHNSCASKKRKLSSDNKPVTTENRQHSAAENSSSKEAESNMPQTSKELTATRFNTQTLNQYRAQPIFQPIWRGSISIKGGNICSIDGLVVHISSLACSMVHKTASSLQDRLSAEMFPRLEIWPLNSFLKNGGPNDGSIALYFFPSIESKDEKVFYSLVLEMKKNDLAMRCVLDNADLLLFTSYTLPMDYWFFHSKEYLWGIFRRRQVSRN